MSNYPAGVTGNERQIAGLDHWDVSVDCETENVSGVPTILVIDALNEIAQALTSPLRRRGGVETPEEQLARALRAVQEARAQVEAAKGEHVECLFSGDVEAVEEYGTRYWTCPWCGTEHEDNIEE